MAMGQVAYDATMLENLCCVPGMSDSERSGEA